MPLSKVGFNVSGVHNIGVPEFNISNTTTEFINDIPAKANQYTNNLAGLGILIALAAYLYYKLADRSDVSQFGYSQLRSIGLASGIAGVIGMIMFAIGYFTELYPVVLFILIMMIALIWVYKEER